MPALCLLAQEPGQPEYSHWLRAKAHERFGLLFPPEEQRLRRTMRGEAVVLSAFLPQASPGVPK